MKTLLRHCAAVTLVLLAGCTTPPQQGAGVAVIRAPAARVAAPVRAEAPALPPEVPMVAPAAPSPSGQGLTEDNTASASASGLTAVLPEQLIGKGRASWYGNKFHGRRTASGERYDMYALTAAHKTLPFGTKVRVRSAATGKEVVVRINDRGPYAHQRVIDLSLAAITALGVRDRGVTEVVLLKD